MGNVVAADNRVPLAGWLAWGIASLFYLYEFLVRVAPSVMEPDLQKSFHLSAAGLGAVLGAYYYIYAPLQLVVGGMLDQFGTKRVLTPAVLLCAAGCFMEILSESQWVLLTARLMQGAGSAFAFVGAMHAAAQWFPPQKMAMILLPASSLVAVAICAFMRETYREPIQKELVDEPL